MLLDKKICILFTHPEYAHNSVNTVISMLSVNWKADALCLLISSLFSSKKVTDTAQKSQSQYIYNTLEDVAVQLNKMVHSQAKVWKGQPAVRAY